MMSEDLFKKTVDQLKESPDKIKKIKIGNHGEPTMHSNCQSLLSMQEIWNCRNY